MQELITAASDTAAGPVADAKCADAALAGADLSEIFGVDIESAMAAPAPPVAAPKDKRAGKVKKSRTRSPTRKAAAVKAGRKTARKA